MAVQSRPTRARGLKLSRLLVHRHPSQVAPYAGAWIETGGIPKIYTGREVAPYAGAWIETTTRGHYQGVYSRALRGRVD